ncbi:MAG: SWIM zinc finger family protein [Comamonas sp.]|nr:SWIM zinc finger family protein [Comamonas sp.]
MALSPDAASSKAAKGLQSISKWPSTGSNAAAVWGECQGSGSKPYQTQVDLSGPAFKCSCPSRKFPCKHGLALMLLRAGGQVGEGGEPPEWVNNWLAGRQDKAEKKEAKAAAAVAAPADPEAAARQQARREDKRWDKVAAGMQELSLWMQDMVRSGLANLAGDNQARAQWNNMAARMVDAQAGGMAARIKEAWALVDSHPAWPRDLLAQLGHWQLLVDAVQRRESLSAPVKADVMAALGWPMDKAEVLALGEQVADEWHVVGLRSMEREGRLMERRVWLQGRQSGRAALLLDYSQGGRGFETAWLSGRSYRCALHFYPGHSPLRALLAGGNAEALVEQAAPLNTTVAAAALADLAGRVAANPLQAAQPLWCAQVQLQFADGQWWAIWPEQQGGLPSQVPVVVADDEAWHLLALTGGTPMLGFGEWEPGRGHVGCWRLLSAWQTDAAGVSQCIWHHRSENI